MAEGMTESDQVLVHLEWSFTPADYFEQPLRIEREDYLMTVEDGQARTIIEAERFDSDPAMREKLHAELNDRFLAVQLITHKPFELSGPAVVRVHPDGRRNFSLEAHSVVLVASMGTMDITVADPDGNVLVDSRRDRLERKKTLAELVAEFRPRNPLLAKLLESHSAAVRDPNNELVHLYEIREALTRHFGGEKPARATLGVSSSTWSLFGQICNDMPLRQGRHRGKVLGPLRDATHAELSEARKIAQKLIESYLRGLAGSSE